MPISTRQIVGIAMSIFVIAVIMPIALGYLGGAGNVNVTINGTTSAVSTLVDASVLTILTVLLPILAIVSIALGFVGKHK